MSDTKQTDSEGESPQARQANLAPETHNDEQDDRRSQAHEVAADARATTVATPSPTDSTKGPHDSDLVDDSTQDVVDHMRDMESSGRIDMDAYRGEPNHDDNVDKYGEGHDDDGLRGDGS